MKQLFTLLAITLFGAATWSCSYDDDDLWKEIDGIKTQLAELNKEVSALQTLVDALRQSKTISDVTQTDTGYTITFNDNTSVSIADGKNGTNAPEVGIDLFEGGYYWTIGGKGNWLTDADGHKIPVAGKDGSKPEMAVDADGYWIVDGARIKDAAGNDVKATGSNGKDGGFVLQIGQRRRRCRNVHSDRRHGNRHSKNFGVLILFCTARRRPFVLRIRLRQEKDADAEYDGCGNRRLHEYSRRVEGVAEPCEK